MFARLLTAAIMLSACSLLQSATTNEYWRVDLQQGSSTIAHGVGATQEAAWSECVRLMKIVRAMTAAETRMAAVLPVTRPTVRWCKNPVHYGTVSPDPVTPPPPPPAGGSATAGWQHQDNESVEAGFRIVYGPDSVTFPFVVQINSPAARAFTVVGLAPGTYYFAVKAFDTSGNESSLSNVRSKIVT